MWLSSKNPHPWRTKHAPNKYLLLFQLILRKTQVLGICGHQLISAEQWYRCEKLVCRNQTILTKYLYICEGSGIGKEGWVWGGRILDLERTGWGYGGNGQTHRSVLLNSTTLWPVYSLWVHLIFAKSQLHCWKGCYYKSPVSGLIHSELFKDIFQSLR
jgi:hypothetical protein